MPDPRGNLPEGGSIPQQGDTSASPAHYAAFIATTDYSIAGGFGVIDLDTRGAYLPDPVWAAGVVSPDPVAAAFGDYVFVINRFTYDNVTVLNKRFQLVSQYSVADATCNPSNPHDLAFVSEDKAYLTRYGCRDLWIINPVTGQRLGAIDLVAAGYGGADDPPDMSGLLLHGSTLYVAVQNLDKFLQPTGESYLVLVDIATDTIAGEIPLTGTNPVTDVMYSSSLDRILVGNAGWYYTMGDGGIESIDPSTETTEGYIIDDAGLGGELADFDILSATRGYATVSDAAFQSNLIAFDPSSGAAFPGAVYSISTDFTLWDFSINDRGELYLCDRSATAPGIMVFDTLNNDAPLTPQPINLGLPPFSIVFLR
jgi:hypothetical protein